MNAKIVCKSKVANDNGTLITVSDGIKTWSKNINSNLEAVFDVPGKVKYTISLSRNGMVETKQVGVGLGGYAEVEFGLDKTTWKGLKNIVNAHVESSYCKIGDEITEILSTGEQVTFRIAAINHDSAHQLIFESKHCLQQQRRMNPSATTAGGWASTEIRAWLNDSFFSQLSPNLRAVISQRTAGHSVGNMSSSLVMVTDKIWLPRSWEVFGEDAYSVHTEYTQGGAKQFPIFAVAANRSKTLGKNGGSTDWWLASAMSVDNPRFCVVTAAAIAHGYNADIKLGIVPCFQIVADS